LEWARNLDSKMDFNFMSGTMYAPKTSSLVTLEDFEANEFDNLQTFVATSTSLETLKLTLEYFFSDGRPISSFGLVHALESLSCHVAGYAELSKLLGDIDAISYWEKQGSQFLSLGYAHIVSEANRLLSFVPKQETYSLPSFDYDHEVSKKQVCSSLEEVVYCSESVGVPLEVVKIITQKLFLLTSGSQIPLHSAPAGRAIGYSLFSYAPFCELLGTLTVPYKDKIYPILNSALHAGSFVFVQIPYELSDKCWFASFYGPEVQFSFGRKLFKELRPMRLANWNHSFILRLDLMAALVRGQSGVWISCYDEEMNLCGGSFVSITVAKKDLVITTTSPVTTDNSVAHVLLDSGFRYSYQRAEGPPPLFPAVMSHKLLCEVHGRKFMLCSVSQGVYPEEEFGSFVEIPGWRITPVNYVLPEVSVGMVSRSDWLTKQQKIRPVIKSNKLAQAQRNVPFDILSKQNKWAHPHFSTVSIKLKPFVDADEILPTSYYPFDEVDRMNFVAYCETNSFFIPEMGDDYELSSSDEEMTEVEGVPPDDSDDEVFDGEDTTMERVSQMFMLD